MPKLPASAVAILILLPALLPAQEPNWDRYERRTLRQILEQHPQAELPGVEKGKTHNLFTATFPSRVEMLYTGDSRAVPADRKEHIGRWVESRELSPNVAGLFQTEMRFLEGDREHWLPVQETLVSHFKEELKAGERVELYLVWAGGVKPANEEKFDWVFLVNEFEKL